jgi:hypothetical protein
VQPGATTPALALDLTLRAVLPTEFSETRTRPVRFTLTRSTRPLPSDSP